MNHFAKSLICPLFLVACLIGCGSGMYPVEGTVSFPDGTRLKKGMLILENEDGTLSARGLISPEGNFVLSTSQPGDGMKPGVYKALISSMDLSDVPDEQKKLPLDIKYTKFSTSNLTFEIKPEKNRLDVRITKSGE